MTQPQPEKSEKYQIVTWNEVRLACITGVMRRISAEEKGEYMKVDGSSELDGWDYEMQGSIAEAAVAKLLNRYGAYSVDTYKEQADVGRDYEIRATHREDGCLIVRPRDDPEKYYICCIVPLEGDVQRQGYRVKIAGYMQGKRAMEFPQSNPNSGKPAWFIKQSQLEKFGASDSE